MISLASLGTAPILQSAFNYMTGYIPLVYGIYLDVTSGYMHTAFQMKLWNLVS